MVARQEDTNHRGVTEMDSNKQENRSFDVCGKSHWILIIDILLKCSDKFWSQ